MAIFKVALSIVSILGCLLVMLIIITYKKYMFTFQCLVLYLTLSLLMDAITRLTQGASYKMIIVNTKYCQALAFMYEYWALCVLLSLLCMVLEIVLCVLQNRDTHQLKWIYAAVIYGIPACVSWIPFPLNKYGYAGSACSITYYENDCKLDVTGLATCWPYYGGCLSASPSL